MRMITTNTGYEILVDDEDFEIVSNFVWYVELAGRKTKKPRVYTHIGGRKRKQKVYLSRMLMGEPEATVDHISGDTLDNRRDNMRVRTQAENSRNIIKHHRLTSKYKGVSLRRNKEGGRYRAHPWIATITVNRKRFRLGFFEEEIAAAKAYDIAAVEYFGQFARLNFEPSITT